MNIVLTYKDVKDCGWPDHRSKISYYVLDKNFYLEQSLHPQYYEVTYEWYSKCHEVNEYYDPITQGHFKLGDSKPSEYFSDDENESHRTVYLGINLEGYHHRINDNEDLPRIAWEYTHDIQRCLSKYQGREYFPCFDINNLLRERVVTPVEFSKYLVGEEGNQYCHISGRFLYKGEVYYLKMAQDSLWEEDDWVKEGKYGKVDIFQWSKV
ncbi:conserved hypothetical protein [Vibrio phage 495E54-1]|nr:conserved hypothetical protein [Vibrio phage 495E54-1]